MIYFLAAIGLCWSFLVVVFSVAVIAFWIVDRRARPLMPVRLPRAKAVRK